MVLGEMMYNQTTDCKVGLLKPWAQVWSGPCYLLRSNIAVTYPRPERGIATVEEPDPYLTRESSGTNSVDYDTSSGVAG